MKSTILLCAMLILVAPAQAAPPADTDCVYDYGMITARECREYRAQVLSAQSEEERLTLLSGLQKLMEARALERGVPVYHWRGIEEPSTREAGGASIALLAAGLVSFIVVAFFVAHVLWPVRRMSLMRCPETGTIAFVDAGCAPRADGKAPAPTVRSCELWPKRSHCARGCLERYEAAAPGLLHVKSDALRPFEQP